MMFRLDIATIQKEPSSRTDVGSFLGHVYHDQKPVGRYRLTLYRRQRLADVVVTFREETKRPDDGFSIDLHKKIAYEDFQADIDTLIHQLLAHVLIPSWQLPGSSHQGQPFIFEHVTTRS